MPRSLRKQSSTGIYHVITRGVDRMDIFYDVQDRSVFLKRASSRLAENGGILYAWCLMTNHVHLLVRFDEEGPLSGFMHKLNTDYAIYINSKYDRDGHLFQGRFKSEPIESDSYFLTVVRYIHQNPVKAFMTKNCSYRWSSFDEYIGEPKFCDTEFVLAAYDGLENFMVFHGVIAYEDKCLDLKLALSDEDALSYAEKVLGSGKLHELKSLGKDERDAIFRTLKGCMLPVAQIARITGCGKTAIYAA